MAEKPIPLTPGLVIFPPAFNYYSEGKGRSLGCQVWETEALDIEPQGYRKLELVVTGTWQPFCLSLWVLTCAYVWSLLFRGDSAQGEPQSPGPGSSTRPVFPKLFEQKKPPSVFSCHSNLLMQRDGPQRKGPARTQVAPFLLFSQVEGQEGTAGGKIAGTFTVIPLTILPGR